MSDNLDETGAIPESPNERFMAVGQP